MLADNSIGIVASLAAVIPLWARRTASKRRMRYRPRPGLLQAGAHDFADKAEQDGR